MPFVMSAQEAQAIQEDEVQLVMALAQMSQRVPMVLHRLLPKAPSHSAQPEGLRIFLGRRLVYGTLVDGTFRRELDRNGARVILDAIQKNVTESTEAGSYRGQVPAIEIYDGESLLFREERDGTVTVNQIQLQISGHPQAAAQPLSNPVASHNGNEPQTHQVEQTVRDFLQNHVKAARWSKEGGQFQLEIGAADEVRIIDRLGRGVIYDSHQGEAFSRLTPQDFAYFSRLQKRMQQVEQKTLTATRSQLEIG